MDWTQAEFEDLDRKIRKLMSAHHALHHLFPLTSWWTRTVSIKQTVEEEKRALNDFIKNRTEHALKAVSDEELLKVNESKSEYHMKGLKNRQERWQSKPLHGQYLQDIKNKTDNYISWSWLKNGELKKETEGFLMAV